MFFNRVLIFFLLTFSVTINAQVNNIGQLYIAGNVFVNAPFTNSSTATYTNNGDLYISQQFTNDEEAMAEGTGTTYFIGNTKQLINGSEPSFFHDIFINNSNGVTMDVNVTAGGIISPQAGTLYFNDHTLTIGGKMSTAYTNTAAFNVTPLSNLIITGPGADGNPLYFDAAGNTMHNLTVTSGASGALGNALDIAPGTGFGTVTVDGNFKAAGFLTFKSDSNGTARVGKSKGVITGNATAERYITARRAWRFLSVPFSASPQTIRDAWQEGVNNTDPTLNYANNKNPHPGYGTHITGNNNTSLGYDFNTTSKQPIRVCEPYPNNWNLNQPATNAANITDYSAYYIFVRGSRAINLASGTSARPDSTVLRIAGVLNQTGPSTSKTYKGTPGNIVFVGNPYVSTINITELIKNTAGIEPDKFWVWDPQLKGRYGVGGYVAYSDGVIAPPSSPSFPDVNSTLYIQSGQAFMLQLDNTSNSVTINFHETDKDSVQSKVFGFQRTAALPVIYTNLVTGQGRDMALIDGVAAAFDNSFGEKATQKDARKSWNFDENIAMLKNGKFLSIDFRPVPASTDTIFLSLYTKQQPYALQIFTRNSANIPVKAWLVDRYLNIKKLVNLQDTSLYNFIPAADTNSYRNRFMLVFKRTNDVKTDSIAYHKPAVSGVNYKISIYPNPVIIGEKAALNLLNVDAGEYEVVVYSLKGQKLMTQKLEHDGHTNTYLLTLPKKMTSGIYNLKLTGINSGIEKTVKLIIASK